MKFAERAGTYFPVEVLGGSLGDYRVKFEDGTETTVQTIESYTPPFPIGREVDWVDVPLDSTSNSDKNKGTVTNIQYYRPDTNIWFMRCNWPRFKLSGKDFYTVERSSNLANHYTGPKNSW